MTIRLKARIAAVAVAALAAPLVATSAAHASTGGGCRAWYSYSGMDLQVRPCISASGTTVNASGYLLGSQQVSQVELRLIKDGRWTNTYDANCSGGLFVPAGQCTDADNMSFGPQEPGHTYYVDIVVRTGYLSATGPVESPGLHLS